MLVLETALPFCLDRLMQYAQPVNIVVALILSYAWGVQAVRAALLGSSLLLGESGWVMKWVG